MKRLYEKIDRRGPDECWPWLGCRSNRGYGRFRFQGRVRQAHAVVYEIEVGPVPPGRELDHLCRNTFCVNPAHLEPVTHSENLRRAPHRDRGKTHCIRGHPLSGENLYEHDGRRHCRTCRREAKR